MPMMTPATAAQMPPKTTPAKTTSATMGPPATMSRAPMPSASLRRMMKMAQPYAPTDMKPA